VRPVFLTLEADEDLAQIWMHIAITAHHPLAATRLIEKIAKRYAILSEHPYAGVACDELLLHMRALTAGSYCIFYRVSPERIEILRILHTARNLSAIFES